MTHRDRYRPTHQCGISKNAVSFTSHSTITPSTRHRPYEPYPGSELPRLHRLQPLGTREKNDDGEEGDKDVAREELVEVPALLLDDAPAGLPCRSFALRHLSGRVSVRLGGVERAGRGRGDAVDEATVAKWLAERFVELERGLAAGIAQRR